MTASSLSIPADVRERVIAAAVELYEQAGRERFPTVDAVRRASRADMNTVSLLMREWRDSQRPNVAPIAVPVPEVVAQAHQAALASVWMQAQELANESLRKAQAGWQVTWNNVDEVRQQAAEACDRLQAELNEAKQQLADAQAQSEEQARELAAVRQREAEASSRADRAEARVVEMEKRVDDLRGELELSHAEVERVRADQVQAAQQSRAAVEAAHAAAEGVRAELVRVQATLEAQAQAHADHRKMTAAEVQRLGEQLTNAQIERDQAAKAAAEARERAAGLAGQLEATQGQNAALLAAIKTGQGGDAPAAKGGKK